MENLNEIVKSLISSSSPQSKLQSLHSLRQAVATSEALIEDVEGLFKEFESLMQSSEQLATATVLLIADIALANKDPIVYMYLSTFSPTLVSALSTESLPLVSAIAGCMRAFVAKEIKLELLLGAVQRDGVCSKNPLVRSRAVELLADLLKAHPRLFEDSKYEPQALKIVEEIIRRRELRGQLQQLVDAVPSVDKLVKKLPLELQTNYNIVVNRKANEDVYDFAANEDIKELTLREVETCEYGIVPTRIIKDLHPSSNWKRRAGAIEELEEMMGTEKNCQMLEPYASSFLLYLVKLLDDPNYKIVVVTLQIINKLLQSQRSADSVQPLIPALVEKFGDTKAVTRQLAVNALRLIGKVVEPSHIVSFVIPYLSSPKSHIREEILNLLIILFIENSDSLNAVNFFSRVPYRKLIRGIAPLLDDDKPKIAQVAFEAYATIARLSGTKEILSLLHESIRSVELFAKLQHRIKANCIPILNAEGILEFPIDPSFTGLSIAQYNNLNNASEKYSRFTSAGAMNRAVHRKLPNNQSASKRPQTNEVEEMRGILNISPRFGAPEEPKLAEPKRSVPNSGVRPAVNAGTLIMGMNVPFSKESNRTDSTRSGSTEPNARGFGERFKFLKSAKPFDVGKDGLEQQALGYVKGYQCYNVGQGGYEGSQRRFSSLSAKTRGKGNLGTGLQEAGSYLAIEDLKPMLNPEANWVNCVKEIKCSNNPAKQFEACNIARRLCVNHSVVISDSPLLLRGFVLDLLRLIESQKTNLSKNALLVLNDLYASVGEAMDDSLEVALPTLLRKGTEPGSFLGPHVVGVLKRACENCGEAKVVGVLAGVGDLIVRGSCQVKLRVIHCLTIIIKKLNKKIGISREGERIMFMLGELLSESSLEVRNAAKEAFALASDEISNPLEFQGLVRRAVASDAEYKLLMSKVSPGDFPVEAALDSIRKKPFIGQRKA